MLTYEFPLNEKSRTYLRFDALFQLLRQNAAQERSGQAISFFKALFDFIELSERCDIRTDLMKDLEKQRQKLESLRQMPSVDTEKLQQLLDLLASLIYELPRSVRAGTRFKEDKFLCSIRQRFAIPGGLCPFDVPILHHWLGQPLTTRVSDAENWLKELDLLMRATDQLLQLWRESGHFQAELARNGFYQDNADGAELVRLQVDPACGHYPTLSGHKTRFAIRFLPLGDIETNDIAFQLACC
ncbi:cell division protein ZapD [Pseudaeromonas sharmana]|uniref:Cell division protein ZapD n=1 Tax=Pseudaeromonas sharmana TaxID=328412 RepID=A0ABV8CM92_9GAMM